jgi:protein-L-isoaspartate(D-aspartate) O-methyltransferase
VRGVRVARLLLRLIVGSVAGVPGSPNDRMVDRLLQRGRIRSDVVAAAMRAVDRARFVPAGELDSAYDDAPIRLDADPSGEVVSTISQPTMVAYMLEQLALSPGQRVLEIGTASGWNAALLAWMVGQDGVVVTVEVDRDLAAQASARLGDDVQVVHADGHGGWPPGAPYDRIVVTAGARQVEDAWREQLVDGGRLVVPVTGADGRGLCLTLDLVDGQLVQRASMGCGFVTMRRASDLR